MKRKYAIFPALTAGFLNGLLGTGGGIPLWFAVNKQENRRTAFATAATGVLFLCLTSVFLYRGAVIEDTAFSALTLWIALLGSAAGALLLKVMPLGLLRILFSFLMIGAGAYSIIRTVYDVFFA